MGVRWDFRDLDGGKPDDGVRRSWHGYRAEQQLRRNKARRRRIGLGEIAGTVVAGVLLGLGLFYVGGDSDSVPPPTVQTLADAPADDPATVRRYGFCHTGGGRNCVVDGDTFWMDGEKIRIADIDTPETHPSRCPREAALGARATKRLHALLNAGPVTLEPTARDTDRYGRKLRIVTRDGESLGAVLVSEGLAREWGGPRRSWCG